MPDDSNRGGWLRGLSAGSSKKAGDSSPRFGKPLEVAVAEKPTAAGQSTENRATRGLSFRPGQLFHHFRLQQQLGRGATATVYRAIDERTNGVVALKLLCLADDWPDDLLDEAKLRRVGVVLQGARDRVEAFLHLATGCLANRRPVQQVGNLAERGDHLVLAGQPLSRRQADGQTLVEVVLRHT